MSLRVNENEHVTHAALLPLPLEAAGGPPSAAANSHHSSPNIQHAALVSTGCCVTVALKRWEMVVRCFVRLPTFSYH